MRSWDGRIWGVRRGAVGVSNEGTGTFCLNGLGGSGGSGGRGDVLGIGL